MNCLICGGSGVDMRDGYCTDQCEGAGKERARIVAKLRAKAVEIDSGVRIVTVADICSTLADEIERETP